MTNKSGNRPELKGKSNPDPSLLNDENSMENLAKKALAETIRDGGAFAHENSNQFKQ